MSYATLLLREGIESQFLAIVKPRRQVNSFTLVSGTKYTASFDYGQVIQMTSDGVVKVEATSSALSDGDWYHDVDASTITLDFGADPSALFVVATYELYFGTFDAHFNRIPSDSTSRVVYYEPLIVKSPVLNQYASDVLFGVLPSRKSQLIISNATLYLQRHLYDSSFNECDIDLWHYLDSLETANVKLLFKGICGNVSSSDTDVLISVFDRNKLFENEYRHSVGESFFGTSAFPNIDPNYRNRPIRTVYGVVNGFIPVNIDYDNTTPTTSNNRTWVCVNDETNLGSITATVPASPTSTTTRTYVDDVTGFNVGDSVWIDSASGSGFDEFVLVTAVGANYIDHATVTNVAATSSAVKRLFVGRVDIYQDNVQYTALYGRDYDVYTDATNKVAGFTFTSTLESNLSMPATLSPNSIVYARVYGHTNQNTLSASPFGADSTSLGCLAQGIVILYEILKTKVGVPESGLDLTAFSSLQSTVSDEFGFAVPALAGSDFPVYRDLIGSIAASLLLKIYLDSDNKWSIAQVAPIVSTSKTIEDDEILLDTFSYNITYDDTVSKVIVEYARREVTERNQLAADSFSRVTSTSEVAQYVHGIKKQKTFYSLHWESTDAQTLSDRLAFIFGDRSGVVMLSTKNRFFDTDISDKITVSRARLNGYEFDIDVNRSRDFEVTLTEKSLDNINIEMNDQKGVQDNSGGW